MSEGVQEYPVCADPGCDEHLENRFGSVCKGCGAFFCEEHILEKDGDRRCLLCRRYDHGKYKIVQHRCTNVVWTYSNDLVSILNKMGEKGWVLLEILDTRQERPDESDGEMITVSKCLFRRERR